MTGLENELDEISLELARRERDEAIRYWTPNGGQEKFLDQIFKPGAYIVVNGSGNGGGKTHVIIAFAAACVWPDLAPPALNRAIIQKWPYPKRIRIISTHKEVEEIGSIQSTIKELFPKGRYHAAKNQKKYLAEFVTDTGWTIDVMTYDQAKEDFAGPQIGLTLFNEPMPEGIWKESIARTRKGGLVLVAMTSLDGNPWVVDGILSRAGDKDVRVVYCDQEENCIEHGKNGKLNHADLERILKQYPEDEREARKTGKPLSLSGRIFKTFDRSVHVAKEEITPPTSGVAHYMVCDPAIGKPFFCIWAYVDRTGLVKIYREWPEFEFEGASDSNLGVKEYAELFKTLEAGAEMQERILDRHFGNVRRNPGGPTLREQFSEVGIDFVDSYAVSAESPEVETGILKVKDYLRYDKTKTIDLTNCPRIEISPSCRNTIAAFERWGRNPLTGKPLEAYKDPMDDVRYLLMANPEVEEKINWPKVKKPYYGVGV